VYLAWRGNAQEHSVSETPTITVLYERKLSDGNYGSEGLSMAVSHSLEPSERLDDVLVSIARAMRQLVLGELARSAAPQVARMAEQEFNPGPRAGPVRANNAAEELEDLPF
jgi:hypothetical protein